MIALKYDVEVCVDLPSSVGLDRLAEKVKEVHAQLMSTPGVDEISVTYKTWTEKVKYCKFPETSHSGRYVNSVCGQPAVSQIQLIDSEWPVCEFHYDLAVKISSMVAGGSK